MRSRLAAMLVAAATLLPAAAATALPSANAGEAATNDAATTVEGVVRTLATDTAPHAATDTADHTWTGRSQDVYRQVLFTGTRSYFLKGAPVARSGYLRVTGRLTGNTIDPTSVTTLQVAPTGLATATAGAPVRVGPTGTTRVLVMLAYWTAPDDVTPASAAAQMFTDSNGWFRDASYGALGQSGAVTPWLRIAGPAPATACYSDHQNVMNQAKAAARTAGYDPSAYTNHVLYFPSCGGDAAGVAGWAYVGWTGTWLNGYMDRRVTVHEQGHNYGLVHSHSRLCGGGGLTGSCTFSDYGDDYDAMGASGYVGHFSAPQKNLLSWLSGGRVVDLTAGGSTTLVPMADNSTAPHAAYLTVPGSSRRYWLEYRQRIDYDSSLPLSGTNGVLVHVTGAGSGSDDSGSSLIDVQGDSTISVTTATLRPGKTWITPEGRPITVNSATAAGASVTIGAAAPVVLTVRRAGTGAGTVTSAPAGIACGATCSVPFAAGSSVTLTATPAAGSTFTGWNGACSGTAARCVLPMTVDRSATATFSPIPRATLHSEMANGVEFAGWRGASAAGADGGSYRDADTAGATASFSFSGSSVSWLTRTAPDGGTATVSIDGVAKGTVDLYAPEAGFASFPFAGLTSGGHRITVTVGSGRNASATGGRVAVDGFRIGATTIQDAAVSVGYGSWAGARSARSAGAQYRASAEAGATATFAFTGSSVGWVTATGPRAGKARVFIDGVDRGMVDLYSPTRRLRVLKPYGGLSDAEHTITIQALGTRNAAASGAHVAVDGFQVLSAL